MSEHESKIIRRGQEASAQASLGYVNDRLGELRVSIAAPSEEMRLFRAEVRDMIQDEAREQAAEQLPKLLPKLVDERLPKVVAASGWGKKLDSLHEALQALANDFDNHIAGE